MTHMHVLHGLVTHAVRILRLSCIVFAKSGLSILSSVVVDGGRSRHTIFLLLLVFFMNDLTSSKTQVMCPGYGLGHIYVT